MILLIIGFLSGIISGMGIGGGTILIPSLILLMSVEQQVAQSTNLLYFVPTAIVAIIVHIKQKNIEKKLLKPLIIGGLAGAICGAILANYIEAGQLRKLFGGFLFIMGIMEIKKSLQKK